MTNERVLAHSVARRRREIGIQLALGAYRTRMMRSGSDGGDSWRWGRSSGPPLALELVQPPAISEL